MPQDFMDWVVVIGVLAAVAAVVVAFMRRPKKTDNTVTGGSHNTLSGGDGTTRNSVKDGDHNNLSG